MTLFTGVWFLSALFNIPTGAIADIWGRKRSYIIGKILTLLIPITYILNPPLIIFITLLIVAGFGIALTNGTLFPLVHAAYLKENLPKKNFNSFLTRSRSILFISRAVSGIGGAWLFSLNPTFPFFGGIIVIISAIFLGFLLPEEKNITTKKQVHSHILTTVRSMWSSGVIKTILISYIIISVGMEAVFSGYQILYRQDGRSALVIGSLFSIIAVFSAVSAYFVRILYSKVSPLMIHFYGSVLMLLTTFLLLQPDTRIRLFAIVPMAIASGGYAITVNAVIQHVVPNKLQSTAISIYAFIMYSVYTLSSVYIGWIFDSYGVDYARQTLFYLSVSACVIILILNRTSKTHAKFKLEERVNGTM